MGDQLLINLHGMDDDPVADRDIGLLNGLLCALVQFPASGARHGPVIDVSPRRAHFPKRRIERRRQLSSNVEIHSVTRVRQPQLIGV